MIREIANCDKTQHITKIVGKMLQQYNNIRKEYVERGDITLDKWPTPFQDGSEAVVAAEEEQAFSA